jgi:hypothetical protein
MLSTTIEASVGPEMKPGPDLVSQYLIMCCVDRYVRSNGGMPIIRLNEQQTSNTSTEFVSLKLFEDRGSHVFSVTVPYGRILGFLDRSRYFFFQVAPQLYSPG